MTDKILLVSDTTERVNWGARGASLALQQMLISRFGSLSVLPGSYANTKTPADLSFLNEDISSFVFEKRHNSYLCSAIYKIEKSLGAKLDFIEKNPKKSAKNIRNKTDIKVCKKILDKVRESEKVIIDGNGDMVFRNTPDRVSKFNMSIIELSSSLGKEVHYVNSIFSDSPYSDRNPEFFKHVISSLSKCSTIALRDPFSMRLANSEAPHLSFKYVPDSLFHWYERLQDADVEIPSTGDYTIPFRREETSRFGKLHFDEPYICISGGSRASWYGKDAVAPYARLVEQVKQLGLHVYLAPACSGDEFMYEVSSRTGSPVIPAEVPIMMGGAILSKAHLLITGRYHPSIFASLGGTPCIFLGADSHKTRSIQDVLRYETKTEFSALPDEQEVEEICELAEQYLRRGDSLRSDIRSTAKECAESARRVVDLIE